MKKQYKSPELELYRMSIFADNLALIEQSNSIQSEYKLGLTAFADLTQEEFSSLFLSKVEQENNE
jgi:xylem cysteine proteinase